MLYAFSYDAKRFILHNRWVIEQAPLRPYFSVLIFTPENSIVRRCFDSCIPSWIQTKPRVLANWNVVLQTLEGHSDPVKSVAFSRVRKWVVSGSDDETVILEESREEAR